eukprot:13541256-Alexandrium_andersonii.AAC.1
MRAHGHPRPVSTDRKGQNAAQLMSHAASSGFEVCRNCSKQFRAVAFSDALRQFRALSGAFRQFRA